MKPQDDHIWKLITRVLSGEADPDEEKELQQWLEADAANERFFEGLEACWQEEPHEDAVNPTYLFDYEHGLGKLRSRIRKEKQRERTQSLHASVNRNRFLGWKVAAPIVLLLAAISFFGVRHFWIAPVTSYATSAMEQRIIRLPDGSTVRLNRNSKISFPKDFAGVKRKVTLDGEAFFQVKHNDAKPFIVQAGDAIIQDKGTSFNVNEQKKEKVVIAVKEGMVLLRNSKNPKVQKTTLEKNQLGILDRNVLITLENVSVQNYLGWVSGKIVFKKMPFDKVVRQLENIYGIHCQLADSTLRNLKLTAYIKNTSLHDVLHMIALSLDIHYRKEGNKVTWMSGSAPKKHKNKKGG
jgi:ferric-dicitrate binding protein FerR (iron transport regulator)